MKALLRLWLALAAFAVIALSGCESGPVAGSQAVEISDPAPSSLEVVRAQVQGDPLAVYADGDLKIEWYAGAAPGAYDLCIFADVAGAGSPAFLVGISPDGSQASSKPCSYTLWKCINLVLSSCGRSHPNTNDPDEAEAYRDCVSAGLLGCYIGGWLFGWACDGTGHSH